jgi:hypothetical protein
MIIDLALIQVGIDSQDILEFVTFLRILGSYITLVKDEIIEMETLFP